MSDRLNAPEALIFAMVTVSAADRTINSDELGRMRSIVQDLPAFAAYDIDWFNTTAGSCGKLLAKPGGVEKVLGLVRESLPPRLYETAYVLAAEVAASDLVAHTDEDRFLSLLGETLGLDKLVRTALDRAAHARHQRV